MPNIDWDDVPDAGDMVPEGAYTCRLADVEETESKAGNEMWNLRWEVTAGEHQGAVIFDRLVFSGGALKRVKLLCSRLGMDVSGKVNLLPEHILGLSVIVHVEVESYEYEGREGTRNAVPFAGYEAIDDGPGVPAAVASPPPAADGPPPVTDDDIPF